jgi:protein SCO1/2
MRGAALARAAGLVCLLGLPACDAGAPAAGAGDVRRYDVRGVVEDVDPGHGQVLLDHEDIPGLMPAMTMTFDVPNAALLGRLAAGQRIEAKLEVSEGHFRLVDARIVEEKAAAGRAGALAGVAGDAEPAADFSLIDQDGRTVTLASLRGKTVLLDFIYTHCPGPCPVLTARHAAVQRELAPALRDGVRFVSISLDPARDTPEALRAYGAARGADFATWSFLTGSPDDVRDVLRRYGVFAQESATDGEVDHVVVTMLIDREGRIAKRFFGVEASAAEVRQALETLAG